MRSLFAVATLGACLALCGSSSADEKVPQPGQPARKIEVSADIVIARGSNAGKGIDPKLAKYKRAEEPAILFLR